MVRPVSLRSDMARDPCLIWAPPVLKHKPYENDQHPTPKYPTSNWSKTPVPIPSANE